MVREKMKGQGRYFLRKRSRSAVKLFYHESGTQHVGTPDEGEYINWTRYWSEARSFRSIREARNMATLLLYKYGEKVVIVDRYWEAV